MLASFLRSITPLALAAALLLPVTDRGFAQSPAPQQGAENEAEVILKDAKKNDPETRAEYEECLQQWGPQTQMTKEEWAASCRATLKYFPEQ